MKKYEVYRNIRKRAVIFGLPLTLFSLQMVSVIGSLMVIIFSFGLGSILSVLVLNPLLYMALTKVAHNPQLLQLGHPFPKHISNRQNTFLAYEDN